MRTAFGFAAGPPQTGRVTRVFRRIAPAILWLTLATGEAVGTTPGHEVWTFERGWGPAAELTAGASFLTPAGAAATIVEIIIDPTPTPVYNFEVRGTHTYFAAGVWVHNDSCTRAFDVVRHHLLPVQFKGRFKAAGLDIEDFVLPVEADFHKFLHGKGGTLIDSWNGRWADFWSKYPEGTVPSKEVILGYYATLFKEFLLD